MSKKTLGHDDSGTGSYQLILCSDRCFSCQVSEINTLWLLPSLLLNVRSWKVS